MIGIRPLNDVESDHYSSKCQKCGDDEYCDIRRKRAPQLRQLPIISLLGPIWYKIQQLWCEKHKCYVDFFDFTLGDNDEFLPETIQAFDLTKCGLIKYGHYIYTQTAFASIWNHFAAKKKPSEIRNAFIRKYVNLFKYKFDENEIKTIINVFDNCDGIGYALKLLFSSIVPSIQTFGRLSKDIGCQFILPLAKKLKKSFAKLGSRVFSFDATFKFLRSIILNDGKKTKIALLTILDEWGNYVGYTFLPNALESQEYIVPAIAECVYDTLKYGPYRSDQKFFGFKCDDAAANVRTPALIFKYIQENLNNDRQWLKGKNGNRYNLRKLGYTSKV